MAGLQPVRDDARAEGIADSMERRRREVAARSPEAEFAGRAAWADGAVAGELPYAPRPSDVVTLGARTLQRGLVLGHNDPDANGSTFSAMSGRPPASWGSVRTPVRPVAYRLASTAVPVAPAAPARPRPTQEDDMAKLRRDQAAFKDVVREESRRNSWMAILALAPIAVPLLAEGAALLTGRLAASQLSRAPLNLLGREPSLARAPLARAEKDVLRSSARKRVAKACGESASELGGEVHHRVALRSAHLFPNADPNRLANLVPLMREAHVIASRAEAEFVRSLAGRPPTQAEVMAHAMRLDKLIEPYVLRAGVARPPPMP